MTHTTVDRPMDDELPSDVPVIDLDQVVALLHAHGVPAAVERTGGNCASLFAGPKHIDAQGDLRYAVAVGGGFLGGTAQANALAYVDDLVIGADGDDESSAALATANEAELVTAILDALGIPATGPAVAASAPLFAELNPRRYDDREPDDRSDYLVVDLHGVSIGVKRRANDLYVHIDTSETPDEVVAVEINGGGEIDHPIR